MTSCCGRHSSRLAQSTATVLRGCFLIQPGTLLWRVLSRCALCVQSTARKCAGNGEITTFTSSNHRLECEQLCAHECTLLAWNANGTSVLEFIAATGSCTVLEVGCLAPLLAALTGSKVATRRTRRWAGAVSACWAADDASAVAVRPLAGENALHSLLQPQVLQRDQVLVSWDAAESTTMALPSAITARTPTLRWLGDAATLLVVDAQRVMQTKLVL